MQCYEVVRTMMLLPADTSLLITRCYDTETCSKAPESLKSVVVRSRYHKSRMKIQCETIALGTTTQYRQNVTCHFLRPYACGRLEPDNTVKPVDIFIPCDPANLRFTFIFPKEGLEFQKLPFSVAQTASRTGFVLISPTRYDSGDDDSGEDGDDNGDNLGDDFSKRLTIFDEWKNEEQGDGDA